MSLNLTGLADVAERSLQQIAEIADDRRQTLDGAKHHHAHVDVRLNELEESALSSLLMPMCAHSRARPALAPSPAPTAAFAPRPTSSHHPAPTSSHDSLQPPASSPRRRLPAHLLGTTLALALTLTLTLTRLPAHLLGTLERGARTAGDDESMEADHTDRPPSPSRLEEGDFLLCFGTSGPSDLQLETEGHEGHEGHEEGQNEEGRLQLLLNGERIARPSVVDMRARVYEAATEAAHPCPDPECGRTFDNRQRLKVHMSEHDAGLSLPKVGQARRRELEPMDQARTRRKIGNRAQCPACPALLNTMQLLTRHYARKHMSGERLFECGHCGLKFATSNDCGSHQKLCLRGDNAGKVIRCDACGEEFSPAKAWTCHSRATKHKRFTVAAPTLLPGPPGAPGQIGQPAQQGAPGQQELEIREDETRLSYETRKRRNTELDARSSRPPPPKPPPPSGPVEGGGADGGGGADCGDVDGGNGDGGADDGGGADGGGGGAADGADGGADGGGTEGAGGADGSGGADGGGGADPGAGDAAADAMLQLGGVNVDTQC